MNVSRKFASHDVNPRNVIVQTYIRDGSLNVQWLILLYSADSLGRCKRPLYTGYGQPTLVANYTGVLFTCTGDTGHWL